MHATKSDASSPLISPQTVIDCACFNLTGPRVQNVDRRRHLCRQRCVFSSPFHRSIAALLFFKKSRCDRVVTFAPTGVLPRPPYVYSHPAIGPCAHHYKIHPTSHTDCGKAGSKRCGGCGSIYYCSVEHQKAHWGEHKTQCKFAPKKNVPRPPGMCVLSLCFSKVEAKADHVCVERT